MIVNVSLNLHGTDVTSSDIYQNFDGFSAVVATHTIQELINGVALNLNDNSKSIKFVTDCGVEKIVDINFNDPTPSVISDGSQNMLVNTLLDYHASVATDGKDNYCICSNNEVRAYNNGSFTVPLSTLTANTFPITRWNGSYFSILKNDGTRHKLENASGWSVRTDTTVSGVSGTIIDYYIHNNIYYIKTTNILYRSTDGVNYLSVLTFNPTAGPIKRINDTIGGYGNNVFLSADTYGFFVSTDNGLNWELKSSAFESGTIYVESNNLILAQDMVGGAYKFTTDGGATWSDSWLQQHTQPAPVKDASITKMGQYYLFTSGDGSAGDAALYYTSDDVYTNIAGTSAAFPGSKIYMQGSSSNFTNSFYDSSAIAASGGEVVFVRQNYGASVNNYYGKQAGHYTVTAT